MEEKKVLFPFSLDRKMPNPEGSCAAVSHDTLWKRERENGI